MLNVTFFLTETEILRLHGYKLASSPKPLESELLFEEEVVEEGVYLEEEVLASGKFGREDNLHRVLHASRAGGEAAVDALGEEDAAWLRVGTWCRVLDEDITVGYYFYLCVALDWDELHRVLEREFNDFLCHCLDVDFASGNILDSCALYPGISSRNGSTQGE